MINERILFGYPIEFKDICLIYPPLNKDIIAIGYANFLHLYSLLTTSFEDLYDLYREKARKEHKKLDVKKIPMPWDYFWTILEVPERQILIKAALSFFLKTDIYILNQTQEIIIGPLEEHRAINKENFFDFQNSLRSSIGQKEIAPPNLKMHPKLMEMKAKSRERDRVKAKQEGNKLSFSTLLLCLCVMNIGVNVDTVLDKTYALTMNLYKFGNKKEKYEIDIKSLIAGGDPQKIKPEQWNVDFNNDD